MKSKKTGKETSLYLPNDVRKAVEERAKLLSRSMSWVVANGLRTAFGIPNKVGG